MVKCVSLCVLVLDDGNTSVYVYKFTLYVIISQIKILQPQRQSLKFWR